jgi:phosphate:Na+ symporter
VDPLLGGLGGLALFLYGLSLLMTKLQAAAGERARRVLSRFTSNRLLALLTGIGVTAMLTSSSATIIMVIGLVNARLLTVMEAAGVILGSNIGTTVSSQVFALDLDRLAPVVLALGLGVHLLARTPRLNLFGGVLLGAGIVFFGLRIMGDSLEPLKNYAAFWQWIKQAENVWTGALAGATITSIIQSSSATMGIVITLASQGMMSLPAGVAVMFGSEVGTCLDTLVASLGRSRSALCAGLFHTTFNLTSALAGICLAGPFVDLVTAISGPVPTARQIANAQLLFNVIGALVLLPVLGPVVRGLGRLLAVDQPAGMGQTPQGSAI